MAKIINSKDLGISRQQMKILYRKNLFFCDDCDLIIAIVPNWAIEEIESILGYKIEGREINDNGIPINKIDMLLKNQYHNPRLYKMICAY